MIYQFDGGSLDPARRELRRGGDVVAVEPQVFDLLQYLLRNRDRVVAKDEVLAAVWQRRVVSESTLHSRIAAVRQAIGDNGDEQRLIRTVARKGLRFVGDVREIEDDAKAAPVADPAGRVEPALAERRQLTILLCDLDARATSRDPEVQRESAATFFAQAKSIVAAHGGFVAHYARGAALAYFGYPQAHEDDAERAIRAAIALVRAVSRAPNEGMAGELAARAGIDTGLVVVGDLLAATGSDHAVVGESPLVAAALLERSARGEVVVSAATRRLVGNLFEFRDIAPVAFMAGVEPVIAYSVVAESSIANRFAALRHARAPLFGRDEEMALLARRWQQARTGEGRVVLVWGEAGIGKSRLVAEFEQGIEGDHALIEFHGSPHRASTALHPVIAQIEAAAGVAIGDDDDDKSRKLEAWWRSECVGMRPDGLALIAELLSLPITGPDTRIAWSPQKRKQMLLDLVVERVATLAARKPLLLVLEDAHWIDPTTHEWLDIMIDRVRSLPVLAIVTYRPEFDPSWRGQAHVTTLTLNRLVPRDSASLARSIAKEGDLSTLLEEIVARTDGVPLFIEETTKSVLESGTMAVPATLQASLVARFDRLPAARGLVQIGAALGREFSYAAVRAVAGMPDAEVAPLLGQLAATELIHQRGTVPDALFTFKHALVQDAAYSTMLAAQRARIHHRIVDTLEAQFAEEALRHPDVLAYHAGEAGLPEKALDYRIKAARMAVERSAGVESQGHVESGMALLQKIGPSPSRRQLEGRLMMALADALVMTRGFASPDVMAALSRARELLDSAAHPVESLRALCGVFQYHFIRSESPHSLAATEPFLDRDADAPTKTVIHYLVGATCLHLGQFARSTHLLESALSLYEEDSCRPVAWIAGHHVHPFTLMWLGLGRLYSGSVGEAAETVAAAVADARARSHPFTLVSTLLALARFRSHLRDLEGAASAIDEGMAIATEQRSPYHVSRASILRGVNLIDSGRARDGIALMMSALEAHRATGANFQSGYNLSKLAEGHAALGEFDRALDFAQQAVADVARTGERWWEAEALRLQGEILLASSPSHRAAAEDRFAQALSCARSQHARLWELRAARSLSGSLLARGKRVDAQSVLGPVCARFAEDVTFAELASARADLSRMGRRVH